MNNQSDIQRLRSSADQAHQLLKALANRDRWLLLCQLVDGERNVGELEELLGIVQPTLSQQLAVLRREGLVDTRREGKLADEPNTPSKLARRGRPGLVPK